MPLYVEHYMFVTRADAPLGGRTRVGWDEVAGEPLCLLHPGMQNRRILDGHLAGLAAVTRAPPPTAIWVTASSPSGGSVPGCAPEGWR